MVFAASLSLSSCTIGDADKPVRIYGQITDSSGKVLSDVNILAKSTSAEDTFITSGDGKYEMVLPEAGKVRVSFSKNGYTDQEKFFVLLGGEKKKLDIILNTLREDAYFNIDPAEKTFENTGGSTVTYINTNVAFQIEPGPSWVKWNLRETTLVIHCDPNETSEERTGLIIFNAEYNLRDTLTIRQLTGPV